MFDMLRRVERGRAGRTVRVRVNDGSRWGRRSERATVPLHEAESRKKTMSEWGNEVMSDGLI
jgi:hypothetical protein